jgi:hypothetical protein
MPLESSQCGLQLCFRPHLDQRSTHGVIALKSCGSFDFGNFRTLETKCHLDVGLAERHRVYYKKEGRWWFPPSSGRGESYEFEFARGES